jgi:hypothetical protein
LARDPAFFPHLGELLYAVHEIGVGEASCTPEFLELLDRSQEPATIRWALLLLHMPSNERDHLVNIKLLEKVAALLDYHSGEDPLWDASAWSFFVLDGWYPAVIDRVLGATSRDAEYWAQTAQTAPAGFATYLAMVGLSFFERAALRVFTEFLDRREDGVRENAVKMSFWLGEAALPIFKRAKTDTHSVVIRWAEHLQSRVELKRPIMPQPAPESRFFI